MIDVSVQMENQKKVELFMQKMPDYFKYAVKEACNKTAQKMKDEAKAETKKETGVKSEVVNRTKIVEATQNFISAQAMFAATTTPIFKFANVSPRSLMMGRNNKKGGVSAMLYGSAVNFAHAFNIKFKSGHVGTVQRARYSKDPKFSSLTPAPGQKEKLEELRAPSAARMIQSDNIGIRENLEPKIQAEFEKNFMNEVDSLLKGFGHL